VLSYVRTMGAVTSEGNFNKVAPMSASQLELGGVGEEDVERALALEANSVTWVS